MPWGFCYFPLFISGGNYTAKVCSLVLALSAKAWNVFFLFVLRNKASLQMTRTSFPPCLCLNHKCLPPDNVSPANLVFLQWLSAVSWSVCTDMAEHDGEEWKLLVQKNICMEQPSRSSAWAFPPTEAWSWTLFPRPCEMYPTLDCLSHYWRGHWCIWLVRKLWRNPSVLAFGWIFISFMGFFCPKESFTLMWNSARSGLFGDFGRKLSSLSLILISYCHKSGTTTRKSVKLSLWKLMYKTWGLWSPPAMEMNSLPGSLLPLVCKCCWSFKMLRCVSEPCMLEYSIQASERGSSNDYTDQGEEWDIRTYGEKLVFWGILNRNEKFWLCRKAFEPTLIPTKLLQHTSYLH